MDDSDLIRLLIPHWYATRKWAEELLVRTLGVSSAVEVLHGPHRGRKKIPGSNWSYRTHGVGVEIGRDRSDGGIDFDFDKPAPDPWRLRVFAEKQFRAGNLPKEYKELIRDKERFEDVATAVLSLPST